MRIALVGYDVEGKATYTYLQERGDEVVICDQKTDIMLPEGAQSQLGVNYLASLDKFDFVVRTAGMPAHIILAANPGIEAKLTSHTNLFFEASPTKHIIGITGTKGKGTTSTLVAKMLEAAGKTVWLGGNIGLPPLTFLRELDTESWVVLELSSFQLSDIRRSPATAVCLMIVPEHLNWHVDMADYVAAKSHLFARQTSDDVAIYFADSDKSHEVASAGAGQKVPYYRDPGAFVNGNMITIDGQEICTTDELQLLGKHNWQNVCAAITTVWQVGVRDTAAIRNVLTSFTGLEHRLELVRELGGIKYYDDSFGTTPETAIVAMEAFPQPKVIVLGGSDKGAQYDDLAVAVTANNVRKILLIGDQASRIQAALEAVGFQDFAPGGETMSEIVANARSAAQTGNVVLLSTGCASFGMFTDYKDRGNQFKAAVSELH